MPHISDQISEVRFREAQKPARETRALSCCIQKCRRPLRLRSGQAFHASQRSLLITNSVNALVRPRF
jgi:hypothetical protein